MIYKNSMETQDIRAKSFYLYAAIKIGREKNRKLPARSEAQSLTSIPSARVVFQCMPRNTSSSQYRPSKLSKLESYMHLSLMCCWVSVLFVLFENSTISNYIFWAEETSGCIFLYNLWTLKMLKESVFPDLLEYCILWLWRCCFQTTFYLWMQSKYLFANEIAKNQVLITWAHRYMALFPWFASRTLYFARVHRWYFRRSHSYSAPSGIQVFYHLVIRPRFQ